VTAKTSGTAQPTQAGPLVEAHRLRRLGGGAHGELYVVVPIFIGADG